MSNPVGMPRYPGAGADGGGAGILPGAAGEEATGSTELPVSGLRKWIRNSGWVFLAVFSFVFFTVNKLPRARINEFIQGNISSALASRGITFSAKSAELSVLLGISYKMKDVTLKFPPPQPPAHVDEIDVSPSILPLLLGKIGATLHIHNGKGDLKLSGAGSKSHASLSFTANHFDIGGIALLKLLTNIAGSATLTGQGSGSVDFIPIKGFNGSTTPQPDLSSANADIQLDLSKIQVDSQPVNGFTIPRLSMASGKVDLSIDHGRGMLRELRIGKNDSPTDDIRALITGDLLLGTTPDKSTCNLKANFSFSPALLKSFSLLNAILAAGRQPDGSFSYKLTGPLLSPNPIPEGGH